MARPFRAWACDITVNPRALPWAIGWVAPLGLRKGSAATGIMMGMIGVEDRDENAAVEKEFQERLPRIRFDLSSRERRMASSTTWAGRGFPAR